MENVLSIQQPESLFKTKYSLAIRIWHWLTFLFMMASIVMVLLAKTLYATKDNIPVVQEQVQQKGGTVSTEQARAVAHEFNDKLWELHKYIGFGLCFLLLYRIIIEVTYSREQKLSTKIKKALAFQTQTAKERYDRKHYIWVKNGYLFFYLLLLIMGATGIILAFEDVASFKAIRHTVGEIHNFVQYLMYAYIFFHIVGVIRADVTDNKGIVSSMINGGPQ